MKKQNLLIIACLLFFSFNCSGNTPEEQQNPPVDEKSWAKAMEMNQRLGRGINIGNTYEAQASWQFQFNPGDLKRIAGLGFTHVRLPIRWERGDRSMPAAPYTITPEFLNTIQSAVDAAFKNKLHIIINMHHHDELFADPARERARFLSQWQQISNHFKGYPDSLLFEILNEPNGNLTPDIWNNFSKEALGVIRKSNPKRCVLLGTAEWGGIGGLKSLDIPSDPYLILTIHYYNPFHFTHQGAEWVVGSNAWLGTKWQDTKYERDAVAEDFNRVKQISREKNIPVHIGEFGAYSKADLPSRVLWTQYLSRWFEQQNFSWAYWEWNSGFGIYNPGSGTYNMELVDALVKNPMPNPYEPSYASLYTSNFNNNNNDGWNLHNNDASAASTLSIANDKAVISTSKPGTANWHIQFMKSNFKIDRDKTYLIRFNAYSPDSDSKEISLNMSKASDPWTPYAEQTFAIKKTDTPYAFVFTPSESDAAARMVFSLGNAGVSGVILYNIELKVQEQ